MNKEPTRVSVLRVRLASHAPSLLSLIYFNSPPLPNWPNDIVLGVQWYLGDGKPSIKNKYNFSQMGPTSMATKHHLKPMCPYLVIVSHTCGHVQLYTIPCGMSSTPVWRGWRVSCGMQWSQESGGMWVDYERNFFLCMHFWRCMCVCVCVCVGVFLWMWCGCECVCVWVGGCGVGGYYVCVPLLHANDYPLYMISYP